MCCFKNNAYGHDAQKAAQILQNHGIKWIAVLDLNEAISIRKANYQGNILVLNKTPYDHFKEVIDHNCQICILDEADWQQWLRSDLKPPFHIKIDTGMHRFGLLPETAKDILEKAVNVPQFKGLFTHLASGYDLENEKGFSHRQIQIFKNLLNTFKIEPKIWIHVFNTHGLIAKRTSNLIPAGSRVGIGLWGYHPDLPHVDVGLRPASKLKAPILSYREVKAGESVSYDRCWIAPKRSVIATVGIGYSHGLCRNHTKPLFMVYKNRRVPVVGAITMDFTLIDVTEIFEQDIWDPNHQEVYVWDNQNVWATDWASSCGMIIWELLVKLGPRVQRLWL